MFTSIYKGMHIHGYFDRDECTVSGGFSIDPAKPFKSYRAAQLAITKAVKAHDAAMLAMVNRWNGKESAQ